MGLVSVNELERARKKKELKDVLARIGRKYLVMSGKGGVGKTTVAVNLAAAKAMAGARVGLLDVDLHGPSAALALGLEEPLGFDESGKLKPVVADYALKAVSIQGLLQSRDEAVIWRGPRKIRAIQQFFSETSWGELDYLFIDAPPGTGDEPVAVLQALEDVRPLIVTSGSRLAIGDVAKAINFLNAMKRPAFGLVDNQSWYVCAACGEVTEIHDRKAASRLAEKHGISLLADLPMELAAARSAEEGRPLVWSRPEHRFSALIRELAEKL